MDDITAKMDDSLSKLRKQCFKRDGGKISNLEARKAFAEYAEDPIPFTSKSQAKQCSTFGGTSSSQTEDEIKIYKNGITELLEHYYLTNEKWHSWFENIPVDIEKCFLQLHLSGGEKNQPIADIESYLSQKPHLYALILGGTGSGKTSLCKHLALKWATNKDGPLRKKFDFLFLVQFNDFHFSKTTFTDNLLDFVHQRYSPFSNLQNTQAAVGNYTTLILLDGFDELFEISTLLNDICLRFENALIVFTARKVTQEYGPRCININRISINYNRISEVMSLSVKAVSTLRKCNKHLSKEIESLCQNSGVLLFLVAHLLNSEKITFKSSIEDLYQAIFEAFGERWDKKYQNIDSKTMFSELSKMAYEALSLKRDYISLKYHFRYQNGTLDFIYNSGLFGRAEYNSKTNEHISKLIHHRFTRYLACKNYDVDAKGFDKFINFFDVDQYYFLELSDYSKMNPVELIFMAETESLCYVLSSEGTIVVEEKCYNLEKWFREIEVKTKENRHDSSFTWSKLNVQGDVLTILQAIESVTGLKMFIDKVPRVRDLTYHRIQKNKPQKSGNRRDVFVDFSCSSSEVAFDWKGWLDDFEDERKKKTFYFRGIDTEKIGPFSSIDFEKGCLKRFRTQLNLESINSKYFTSRFVLELLNFDLSPRETSSTVRGYLLFLMKSVVKAGIRGRIEGEKWNCTLNDKVSIETIVDEKTRTKIMSRSAFLKCPTLPKEIGTLLSLPTNVAVECEDKINFQNITSYLFKN